MSHLGVWGTPFFGGLKGSHKKTTLLGGPNPEKETHPFVALHSAFTLSTRRFPKTK